MRKQQTLPYRWLDALSYEGSINDKERDFFRDGVTSKEGSITDLEARWLAASGYTTGTIEDRWYAYLKAAGFTGTLEDMIKQAYGTIPEDLFANDEVGVWYDPSDLLRYTADSTLGDELVSNGGPFTDTTGWTAVTGSLSVQNGWLRLTSSGTPSYCGYSFTTTVGSWYLIEGEWRSSAGTWRINVGTTNGGVNIYSPTAAASGVIYTAFQAQSTTTWVTPRSVTITGGDYVEVSNISVRELTAISTATLFQDSAGVTPVTALEQPVGLMLDHSQGLVVGSDIAPLTLDTSPWVSVSTSGRTTDSFTTAGAGGIQLDPALNLMVVGKRYKTTIVWSKSDASTAFSVRFATGVDLVSSTASSGVFNLIGLVADTTHCYLRLSAAATVTISSITVQEIAGHHAYQATSASRPTLTARVNKLTYTEDFSASAWTKGSCTISSDAVLSYDGVRYADKLVSDAATAQTNVSQNITGTLAASHTFSCKAKAAEARYLQLWVGTVSTGCVNFDLVAGTVTLEATWTGAIESLGDGWYLCTATTETTIAGTASPRIGIVNGGTSGRANSFTGNGTDGVYIMDADWRLTAHADARIPAYQRVDAATVGTSTAAGVPDYDWDGFPVWVSTDGTDDGMLTPTIKFANAPYAGGATRNLLADSQYFSSSNWTKTRSSISAAAAVAPDGTTTADKLVEDATASSTHYTYQAVTVGAGTYTGSWSVKADERTEAVLRIMDATGVNGGGVTINLSTGALSSGASFGSGYTYVDSAVEDQGSGWYRVELTVTCPAASTYMTAFLSEGGSRTYNGDGSSGIYIWGAQLEAGSSATDYQRTGVDKMTVWAGVTKLSDAARACIVELSSGAANGSFLVEAPTGAAPTYGWQSRGTVLSYIVVGSQTAPLNSVLTGIGNIAEDIAQLRSNGAQIGETLTDQGAGNFNNYPLYLFRRGGSSLPYNGLTSQLIVRGVSSTASEIASIERIVAAKTGKTI